MPTKETRRRWAKEGILSPESIVESTWRCPACGAPPHLLDFASDRIPEEIACKACSFPFSMSQYDAKKRTAVYPVPALSDDWVRAWSLAYKTLPAGVLITDIFTSAEQALMFLENRRPGDSLPARKAAKKRGPS